MASQRTTSGAKPPKAKAEPKRADEPRSASEDAPTAPKKPKPSAELERAPTDEPKGGSPLGRVAPWPFLAIPLVGVWELGAHLRQTSNVVTDDEWRSAQASVAKSIKPEDGLIFAPRWLEPQGRRWMGQELATFERMTTPDYTRYARVVEVTVRGAHREELAGWTRGEAQSFGHVEIVTWQNPSPAPVIDDPLASLRDRVHVTKLEGGGERDCAFEHAWPQTAGTYYPPGVPTPADRYNCGNAMVGVVVLSALDYSGRRCLMAAPSPGMKLRVRFSGVKFGRVLHGNHGLYAEAERNLAGAPVSIDLRSGEKLIGRASHKDGDGWSYFEFNTQELAGQTGDVTAEISSPGADRLYCFEVTTR